MLGQLLFRKITDTFVSDSSKKGGEGTSDRENLYSGRGLIHKYTVCSREKSAKSLGENAKPCR